VAGKKKKEKTAGQPEEEEDDDYPDLDIRPERWVNLRVQFVTWNFLTGLDFGMKVRTSTRLNAIVDKIKDRYGGSIMDVILYRHEVHPQNMLLDLGKTLDEAGFEGGKANPNDPLPDVKRDPDHPTWEYMWYDFKAHSSDCALLLSSPRGASRKDIAKKVEMELEQEAKVKAAMLKKDEPAAPAKKEEEAPGVDAADQPAPSS